MENNFIPIQNSKMDFKFLKDIHIYDQDFKVYDRIENLI